MQKNDRGSRGPIVPDSIVPLRKNDWERLEGTESPPSNLIVPGKSGTIGNDWERLKRLDRKRTHCP